MVPISCRRQKGRVLRCGERQNAATRWWQVTPSEAAKPTQTKIMDTTKRPTELAAVPCSGFTAGPWAASKGTEDEDERWIIVHGGEKPWHIATIENGQPGDCLATEAATAALIAVAPEMHALIYRLATWSARWPRNVIHSAKMQALMDGELIEIEAWAKRLVDCQNAKDQATETA
jgi:hypothetical protein